MDSAEEANSNRRIMFARLFLLFVAVPLLDLFVLLRVGTVLGFWPTVGLVLLTGAIGAALARAQGLRTIGKIHSELAAGRIPAEQLADGAMILLAAALLVTPGFLTDMVGVALLIPPIRRVFRKALERQFGKAVVMTQVRFNDSGHNAVQADWMSDPADGAAERSPREVKYVRNLSADGQSAPDSSGENSNNLAQ